DQDLRPFLAGQLLDAAEQAVVGRQVVGDARLTPDDEVGTILRERASRAELPGQGLRGVDPLHGVVDAGYARLHEGHRRLPDGRERPRTGGGAGGPGRPGGARAPPAWRRPPPRPAATRAGRPAVTPGTDRTAEAV